MDLRNDAYLAIEATGVCMNSNLFKIREVKGANRPAYKVMIKSPQAKKFSYLVSLFY